MGRICCAGHFDVYLGDLFDEVSVAHARFLVERLGATVPVHEPGEALPLLCRAALKYGFESERLAGVNLRPSKFTTKFKYK